MKKVFLLCLIVGLLLFPSYSGEAKRIHLFEAPPNVTVQLSDPRPMIIHASGFNASTTTQINTGNYQNFSTIESLGVMNFSQMVSHDGVELYTNGSNGAAIVEMLAKQYKNYVQLNSSGEINLTQLADLTNIEVELQGEGGTLTTETLTEKYKNQSETTSKGNFYLNKNINPGSFTFEVTGKDGSARILTVTENLKSGGFINSLGGLSVSTVLGNPNIHLEIDGRTGEAAAQALSHLLYDKELNINTLGDISLSQLSNRHQVNLHLDWSGNGEVTNKTSTPNQETTLVVNGTGKIQEELTVTNDNSNDQGSTVSDDTNGEDTSNQVGQANVPSPENPPAPEETTPATNTNNSNPTNGEPDDEEGSNGDDETNEENITTQAKNNDGDTKDNDDNSGKTVDAKVNLTSSELGRLTIIRMNPRGSEPVATDAELVSLRMGMNINQAQGYIRDNGGMNNINYAWEKANSYNPQPPAPVVAGKAGGMNGATSVDVRTLGRPDVYNLHLIGPKYKGFLRDSHLYMRLYYPTNGRRIRGVYSTITVAEPEPPNSILLVQDFPYDSHEDYYHYDFAKKDWLVPFNQLEGPYVLLIDAGQSLNVKLGITITEDGKIIPRNEG